MANEILELRNGTKVFLRHSARAKRIILRVGRTDGRAVLVIPKGVSRIQAENFAASRQEWLAAHQAVVPGPMRVEVGVRLPIGGRPVQVSLREGRRAVLIEGEHIFVPQGRPTGVLIAAFLKQRAREALLAACEGFVGELGPARPFSALALRDTKTRWGSCSWGGRLMFSWRLAMSPTQVLEYVAAHEVAHLRYMDHSPQFWATVERLMPDYREARAWLAKNGPQLLAWQFASDAPVPRHDL